MPRFLDMETLTQTPMPHVKAVTLVEAVEVVVAKTTADLENKSQETALSEHTLGKADITHSNAE
jgi:hypothetical protein